MDKQTDGDINPVWAGQPHPLRVGWRNFFSAVLENFLQPINTPRVCVCVSDLRLQLGQCKCMRYQSLVPSR